jgi:hypothetical protein
VTAPDPRTFDAFFSYASDPDKHRVRRANNFLATFHRQWLLRSLKLHALDICLDGQNFKLRSGGTLTSVEDTLRAYVSRSRYLVVFCSAGAVTSPYVAIETEIFLENHPPSAILPVVTEGDPGAAPETVFPKRLIELGLHRALWLDFRGERAFPWRRRRFRPFGEERVKLAAELHDRSPNILPAWKRAQAIRRAATIAAAFALVIGAAAALINWRRSQARQTSDEVAQEIRSGSSASISDLRMRAAQAISTLHTFETDEVYRTAAALTIRRIDGHTEPSRMGAWPRAMPETFTHIEVSENGEIVAALEKSGGLVVSRAGVTSRCAGLPPNAVGRAVALEPQGTRVLVLLQSDRDWAIAIGDPRTCETRPLSVHPVWVATRKPGDTLGSAPRLDRVRARLNRGGSAMVVASDDRWLLARIEDPGRPPESMNPVLQELWRRDAVRLPGDPAVSVAVADETFSGDGTFVAVAAVRTGVASAAGPRTLMVPLTGSEPPRLVPQSRGSDRVGLARVSSRLAFVSGVYVRVWDGSTGSDDAFVSRTPLPPGGVAAFAFAADDRLLLMVDRDTQPRLHVLDASTGSELGRSEVSTATSMAVGGPNGNTVLVRFSRESALYEVQPPVVERFAKSPAKSAIGVPGGVAIVQDAAPLVSCQAAATQCTGQLDPVPAPRDPNVLASAGEAILYRRDGGVCVASRQDSDPCHVVAIGEGLITAGAIAANGEAVAVAIRNSSSTIVIYHRSLVRWFPWPAWEYVRRSVIDDPGEVKALGFSPDTAWIAAASDWRTELVVRRFPVTRSAIVQAANANE